LITKAKAIAAIGRPHRGGSGGAFTRDRSLGADATGAPSHRSTRILVSLALATTALLAVFAAPASAALKFNPAGQITGPSAGTAFGTLHSESVATNDTNGHIMVADSSVGLVYDFSSASDTSPTTWDGSATPAGSFGGAQVAVAVDESSGDVYVADSAHAVIDKFDASGTLISSFGDTTPSPDGQLAGTATPAGSFAPAGLGSFGIAVDQSTGDLYAIDAGHQVIDVFDSTGAYLSQLNDPAATTAGLYGCGGAYADGIAVNPSSGHVFVSDSCAVQSFEFDNTGAFVKLLDGSGTPDGSFGGGYTSLALESSSGNLYVADSAHAVLDALDSSGAYLGQITGVDFAFFGGVAVDQASGELYLSENSTGAVKIFAAPVLVPDVTTNSATAIGATTATLNGHLDPAGGPDVSDCHFEYVDEATFNSSGFSTAATAPCAEGNSFSAPADVHADLTGLAPDTAYRFRLIAANSNGSNAAADQSFATTGPGIHATFAANVASTSADLHAQIDPNGDETTYRFEYGTDTSYGHTIPVPDADIGAGSADVSVTQHLTGLAPGTTYHYRAVAANSAGTAVGPDHAFTTQAVPSAGPDSCPNAAIRAQQGSTYLPDCRAYEQVTPADKGQGWLAPAVDASTFGEDAAAGGDRMAYLTALPLPGAQSGLATFDLATRGTTGWSSQNLIPPQATTTVTRGNFVPPITAYSPDLSKAVLVDGGPNNQDDPPLIAGEPPDNPNVFLRDNISNSYQLLDPTPADGASMPAVFSGASSDLGHIAFQSSAQLTPDAPAAGPFDPSLYLWAGGQLSLVSQIPPQPATRCGSAGPACVPVLTGANAGTEVSIGGGKTNVISNDGSRVFFTDEYDSSTRSGHWFVRENDTSTVRIDASQKTNGSGPGGTDPHGPLFGDWWGATPDGKTALLTSCEQLTNDSSASYNALVETTRCSVGLGGRLLGSDLYAYDTNSGHLTDLTVDPAPATDRSCSTNDGSFCGANVQGVVGFSDDGSYVYFVANGVLAPGATPGGCVDAAGSGQSCNLYLAHNGHVTFITRLSDDDASDWIGTQTARVSRDGTTLAFTSDRSLTGYDNVDLSSGQPDNEVYLYNAAGNSLACVSCNPTGARPRGPSSIDQNQLASAGDHAIAPRASRNLSDDGKRLFFNSSDALVPADSNDRQDVYEYTQAGAAGCQPAASCLNLLSSGTSSATATFLDASSSGNDVFFTTFAALTPQDADQQLDVYDARADGGFRFTPPPEPCTGDTCKPPPSSSPPDQTPGSGAFSGPGNQGRDLGGSTTTHRRCKKSKKGRKCRRARHASKAGRARK
jgi:hypothetical protein